MHLTSFFFADDSKDYTKRNFTNFNDYGPGFDADFRREALFEGILLILKAAHIILLTTSIGDGFNTNKGVLNANLQFTDFPEQFNKFTTIESMHRISSHIPIYYHASVPIRWI